MIARSATRPPATSRHRNLVKAQLLHSHAARLADRGNYSAATTAFRRALRLAGRGRASNPLLLVALLNDFGVVSKYTGRFAHASRMYLRALRIISGLNGVPNHKEIVATLYHNLAGIEHARRRFALALRYARRGIAIRKTIRPRDIPALAADESAMAAILFQSGRTSESARIFLRALGRFRRSLGPKHYEVGAVLANLGLVYWKTRRPRAAERTIRRAVSIHETQLGKNHPRTASALNNLALICARRGKRAEAGVLYRRVLRILDHQPRSAYPGAAVVRQNYKKLLAGKMPFRRSTS
ncbi:MAG: tetratricopeptide repeat protein [Candidatus Acidiferrales bacterium]